MDIQYIEIDTWMVTAIIVSLIVMLLLNIFISLLLYTHIIGNRNGRITRSQDPYTERRQSGIEETAERLRTMQQSEPAILTKPDLPKPRRRKQPATAHNPKNNHHRKFNFKVPTLKPQQIKQEEWHSELEIIDKK